MDTWLQPHLRGTRSQQYLFDQALAGLHADTRKLFNHLVSCGLLAITFWTRDEWTVCPSVFVREHGRDAELQSLVDRGVLHMEMHNHEAGIARRFKVDEAWLDEFIGAGMLRADGDCKIFDLVTARYSTKRLKSSRSDHNNVTYPPLVVGAMSSIQRSLFNATEVEAHLGRARAVVERAPTESERDTARARLLADQLTYASVLNQGATATEEGSDIFEYEPAYQPQITGRLSERGGGLQSCTREMKKAARTGVPDFRNYDLSASQPRFAAAEMEKASLSCPELNRYISDSKSKTTYAREVGVSVDVWKPCLYAALMGARCPSPQQILFSKGAIAEAIEGEVGREKLIDTYKRFLTVTAGLRAEIDRWHNHILDVWAESTKRYVPALDKHFVTNAVGMKRAIEDASPSGARHELKAKLAAFLLQGLEASVVHRIAIASEWSDYEVMSHEHDGLVVLGEIPRDVVEAAADAAGIPRKAVLLVEKPFI